MPSRAPLSPRALLMARAGLALAFVAFVGTVANAGRSSNENVLHSRTSRLRAGISYSAPPPPPGMAADDDAAEMDMAEGVIMADAPRPAMARMKTARSAPMSMRNMAQADTLGGDVLAESQAPNFDASKVARMLVRTGSLNIKTKADVGAVADAATRAAEAAGGYAERRDDDNGWADARGARHRRRASVTLRIPVDKYAAVVAAFKKSVGGLTAASDVEGATDAVRDVTGEYVDAAARAATLEATRDQLTKLMVRANEVKDVLSVQRELSSVTQQLEARKATMQRLSKSASLSTLQLTVKQREDDRPPEPRAPKGWSPLRVAARAFRRLGETLRGLANSLIFLAVFGLPLGLAGWAVYRCVGVPPRLAEVLGLAGEGGKGGATA